MSSVRPEHAPGAAAAGLAPSISPASPPQPAATATTNNEGPTIELPQTQASTPEAGAQAATGRAREQNELLEYGTKPARQRALDTSIGGYGELHYNLEHVTGPGSTRAQIDLHRLVLFLAHRFNDALRFYSEVEVEHAVAAPDTAGEVEIEQAYLDYLLLGDALGLRAGVILVPMGIINSWHEPPIFHGVERPAVDTVIIPSTWREGGLGVFGEPIEGLRYQLYLMGGLDPTGFSAAQGIREGLQEVALAHADGLAVTGRAEVEPVLGAVVGVSGYFGVAGPNADLYDLTGAKLKLKVPVWGMSADARVRHAGLEARAVFALFRVGDTAALRGAFDADGKTLGIDVGAEMWGAYGELAYDVLRLVASSEQQLLPFVRVERYDTMAQVQGRRDTAADRAYGITDVVMGVSYRPLAQVVFKADFLRRKPDGPSKATGQVDLGTGVMF